MDNLRSEGDPAADAAVREFLAVTALADPRRLVSEIVARVEPTNPLPLPPKLAALLGTGEAALPEWRDEVRLRRGQEFFETHGLPIATALFCASLPVAYLSSDGAQVIAVTGELATNTHRRIAETAQLLAAVMDLGDVDDGHPLAPDTPGYAAVLGVRVLHGAVRAFVELDPDAAARYQPGKDEVPINQEDLLGTLLTFTTVVFTSLDKLGIAVSAEDADAYLHTWCVVGHLLGIRADLLPLSLDEARELDHAIRRRQQRPSDAGVELMHALRTEMRANMPRLLRRFPDALVHQFIGADAARSLGVPDPGWSRWLVTGTRWSGRIWSHSPGPNVRAAITRAFARRMIRAYIEQGREGTRAPWDYSRYSESWKLEPLRTRTRARVRARIRRRTPS